MILKNWDKNKAIAMAITLGHVKTVRALVRRGRVDVNARDDEFGLTLLQRACRMFHMGDQADQADRMKIVKILIEDGNADVDAKDLKYGSTALQTACGVGNLDLVRYLVMEARANVEVKAEVGGTALHRACMGGKLEVVKFLVMEANADVEAKTNDPGSTPLIAAVSYGQWEVVRFLIDEAKLDVSAKNSRGETALHFACHYGNLEIVKAILTLLGGAHFALLLRAKTNHDMTPSDIAKGRAKGMFNQNYTEKCAKVVQFLEEWEASTNTNNDSNFGRLRSCTL